jgi:hypothetical protein
MPTHDSKRSARVVVAAVGASAAIVLVMWLGLRPAQPGPEPGTAAAQAPRIGVTPAATDSARRDHDGDDGDDRLAALAALPVPREQLPAERVRALDEPPPQIPPDPELVAAVGARDAAFATATAALQEALDDRRAKIASACWKGGADPAQVFFQVSFDATGKMSSHDVADNGKAPAGLRECVGKQPFSMTIPAPGAEVRVRATLSLP